MENEPRVTKYPKTREVLAELEKLKDKLEKAKLELERKKNNMEKLKQFIKANQSAVIFAVAILILVAGWFYWYEWRPIHIRKWCLREMSEIVQKSSSDIDFDSSYKWCLIRKGLNK